MSTLAQIIGDCLASFPTAHGSTVSLSYRQAGKLTGVSHSTIQRTVEGDTKPGLLTLTRLAGALDLKLEDLLEAALR